MPDRTAVLAADDRAYLLRLARETLRLYLAEGRRPACHLTSVALHTPRAAFVTLRRRDTGELRGCRGEIEPTRPLAAAVVETTIASATDDPRFPPVTGDEVPAVHIEISVLTPLAPIAPDEVEVGRHGLLIVVHGHRGLLLPQVPLEYGWDRETFLGWVCRKARVDERAWQSHDARLFGFECEVWAEHEPRGTAGPGPEE